MKHFPGVECSIYPLSQTYQKRERVMWDDDALSPFFLLLATLAGNKRRVKNICNNNASQKRIHQPGSNKKYYPKASGAKQLWMGKGGTRKMTLSRRTFLWKISSTRNTHRCSEFTQQRKNISLHTEKWIQWLFMAPETKTTPSENSALK